MNISSRVKSHRVILDEKESEELIMNDKNVSKEQLERRRDEINTQLGSVNQDLQMELDHDMEEQAIEIEQEEVAIAMEHNLRKELNDIEERLERLGDS